MKLEVKFELTRSNSKKAGSRRLGSLSYLDLAGRLKSEAWLSIGILKAAGRRKEIKQELLKNKKIYAARGAFHCAFLDERETRDNWDFFTRLVGLLNRTIKTPVRVRGPRRDAADRPELKNHV